MSIFQRGDKKTAQEKVKLTDLAQVIEYVRHSISLHERTEEWLEVTRDAQARMPGAKEKCQQIIAELLSSCDVEVPGRDLYNICNEVYKELWGMGVLEDIYCDPDIDEIRVNTFKEIYVQRRGKNELVPVTLEDDRHVIDLINRLHIRDRVMATSSTPYVESILKDGSRLTATLPPLTPQGPLFVLRKHGTFDINKENYISRGTMDARLHDILALLAKGQSNMLLIGPGDTGKSTLLRYLIRFFREQLRILLLESDAEIRARHWYPNRDIVEFEEQADLGLDMKNIFPIILRFSPDMVLLGEIRRVEELLEAINACIRGHSGAMATIHYRSVEQALYFLATMLVTTGYSMTIPQAQAMVAHAFNIGVVLYADPTVGIKKVERVAEIITDGEKVEYSDLAIWQVTGDTYFDGEWVFPNRPSEKHIANMIKYGITRTELEAVGWM